MEFSEKIKKLRKLKNLTQEALANELGITFSTVNRWENNKTIPNKLTMQVVENYYLEALNSCKEEK